MKRLTRQAPRSTRSSADAKPATALEFSSLSRPDFLAPIEQKSDYNNSSGKNTKNASSSSSGPGRQRAFDVEEAPTFRPSLEEFQDPLAYIDSIRTQAEPYGIIKVVPPQGWKPTFAIDTEVGSSVSPPH